MNWLDFEVRGFKFKVMYLSELLRWAEAYAIPHLPFGFEVSSRFER